MVTPTRDEIVSGANSVASLVAAAQAFDPALAEQLVPKPLLASKSIWAVALSAALTPVIASYGLDLEAGTVNLLTGIIVTGVATGMRYITRGPVAGIVNAPRP